jgi:hypothetical protein
MTSLGKSPDCGKPKCPGKRIRSWMLFASLDGLTANVARRDGTSWQSCHSPFVRELSISMIIQKNGGCSRKRPLDSARNFAGGKLFLSQGKDKLGRGREAATSQTIAPSGWRGRDAGSFRCPQTSRDATTAISILFLKSPVRTAARNCDLPE